MSTRSIAKRALVDAASALAEAGLGEAASIALSNRVNGFNTSAIATGSIPNPDNLTAMVVVAHATITPKITGKFRVRITIQTSVNADVAAQAVDASFAHFAAPPTDGTTTANADVTLTTPHTPVAIAGSACISQVLYYGTGAGSNTAAGAPTGFPLGTPISFAAMLRQSVAGAFSVPAQGAQVEVEELLA